MKVELAYGKNGLDVELPDERTTVIEPAYVPGLPDERGALLNAIRNPVGAKPPRLFVRPDQTGKLSPRRFNRRRRVERCGITAAARVIKGVSLKSIR